MDERFELIIDVQSRGIRATEKEIDNAQAALDELNREGKVAEQTFAQVSKSLSEMSSALKDGYGQQKQMNAALEAQNKALRERDGLARKQEAGANKGIAAQWDAEFDALNKSTEANKRAEAARATASREAVAGIDRMSSAYDTRIAAEARLNSERARGFQSSKQQMSAWDAEFRSLSRTVEAQQKLAFTSPSLRYALYDVATTATIAATAIAGVGVAAIAASASYERAFANVERTLQPGSYGVQQLRGELLDLSREIPLTFGNISEIATLGNQLGLAGNQVAGFTETVAQFSAVAGTTVQETSLAFGQLDNLLPDVQGQFDRLGSSIALVGVNSAATETQIISVAREIAPAASAAGFAAHEVIGLSGALSSLKVPPERSRSTILQFFETLNMATAEGGDKLENFSRVVGVSAAELEAMVRSGQGRSILERFIGNVSTADTVEITQALDALGLAGLRTNPTIRALAGNMQLLNSTFADGARGWQENTELARQYEIIVKTLSAQWQIFLNALMEFAASVGNAVAPALKTLLDIATDVLNALSDYASTPFGAFLTQTVAGVAALTAVLFGLVGAGASAAASIVAIRFALTQMGLAGATTGLGGLAAAFFGVGGSAGFASGALRAFRVALTATGIGAILLLITDLVFGFGGAMRAMQGPINFFIEGFFAIRNVIVGAAQSLSYFIGMLPGAGIFSDMAKGLSDYQKTLAANDVKVKRQFNNWVAGLNRTMEATNGNKGAAYDAAAAMGDYDAAMASAAGSADKVGGASGGAARQIRTLTDYASDLASVWSRAFEIRFNSQSTLDTIRSSFISIQEATEASARSIAKLKAEISGLQSDLNTQQYFLGIALEYKDYARAEAIQANIAKIQADLADKQASLTDEQSKNSKSLTGNSKAAIANRKTITDLVSQYQAHLQALAASGLSQDQLAVATEQLRQDFLSQATQLGYNRAELDMYARAFDDVRVAIDNVPRNITVSANMDPAYQALNEFLARAASATANVSVGGGGGFGDGLAAGLEYGRGWAEGVNRNRYLRTNYGRPVPGGVTYQIVSAGNPGPEFFDKGGYTGSGGRLEPAGIVHRGEYVIPKHDVNQRTGLPYADALGRLQKGTPGRRGYAGGGYVNPGSPTNQFMYLAPASIQQLAMAMEKYIVVDNRVLAETTSSSYATGTSRGDF